MKCRRLLEPDDLHPPDEATLVEVEGREYTRAVKRGACPCGSNVALVWMRLAF